MTRWKSRGVQWVEQTSAMSGFDGAREACGRDRQASISEGGTDDDGKTSYDTEEVS